MPVAFDIPARGFLLQISDKKKKQKKSHIGSPTIIVIIIIFTHHAHSIHTHGDAETTRSCAEMWEKIEYTDGEGG